MSESCPEKDIPEKRGGTPNFRKFQKMSKIVKKGLPLAARPGGGGGGYPPGGSGRPGRGGQGGVGGAPPPGVPDFGVNPAYRIYRPGDQHYGSSHTRLANRQRVRPGLDTIQDNRKRFMKLTLTYDIQQQHFSH